MIFDDMINPCDSSTFGKIDGKSWYSKFFFISSGTELTFDIKTIIFFFIVIYSMKVQYEGITTL